MSDKIDINAVEDHGGVLTIRGGGARRGWNGIHYKQGMSHKNVGTTKLSANIATIPPGGVAYAADEWDKIIPYDRNAPRS